MAENIGFVVAAYAVAWSTLLGYLLWLQVLVRRSQAALAHARSGRGAA